LAFRRRSGKAGPGTGPAAGGGGRPFGFDSRTAHAIADEVRVSHGACGESVT
jgi:hypothetical protein